MAELVQTLLFKKIMQYLPKILVSKAKILGGQGLMEPPEIADVEIEENLENLAFYEPSNVDYDNFNEQDKKHFLEKLSSDDEFMSYLQNIAGNGGIGLAENPDVET